MWLGWTAQGTRMTGNLLHDNRTDLFVEVTHGPFLIDHNVFLSFRLPRDWSQGGAYSHNLFPGSIGSGRPDRHGTPYRLDTDHFGRRRNSANPAPGPFRFPAGKMLRLQLWPEG